jgi:hypothetical protein
LRLNLAFPNTLARYRSGRRPVVDYAPGSLRCSRSSGHFVRWACGQQPPNYAPCHWTSGSTDAAEAQIVRKESVSP